MQSNCKIVKILNLYHRFLLGSKRYLNILTVIYFCFSYKNTLTIRIKKQYIIRIIMDTKLTLKLDKNSVILAKKFAKDHNQSLSKLVEHFFRYLIKENKEIEYSKLIKELSGIITLPLDFDLKKEHTKGLLKKYNL